MGHSMLGLGRLVHHDRAQRHRLYSDRTLQRSWHGERALLAAFRELSAVTNEMLLPLLAMAAMNQAYDADGRTWRSMTSEVSARCLIEVASATNERDLLTQESYRIAAERKAIQLAGAAVQMARTTDPAVVAHDRLMARQRDLLENGLITRAEYDTSAALAPDLSIIVDMMRAFPTCDFYRARYGPSISRAREILAGRRPIR